MENTATSSLESEPTSLLPDNATQKVPEDMSTEPSSDQETSQNALTKTVNGEDSADVAESCMENRDTVTGPEDEEQPITIGDIAEQNMSSERALQEDSIVSEDHAQEKVPECQRATVEEQSGKTVQVVPQSDCEGRTETPAPATKRTAESAVANNGRPANSPKRTTGTDLIMLSYRDSSSSESSSEESSSSDPVLSISSDEESSSRPQSGKTNGERPNRRGSKDLASSVRTKGELSMQELPPLDDLHIEVDDTVVLHEVGSVSSVIALLVIVQAKRDTPALNADTILFTEDRKVLGQVFETFGPVSCPLYSIRFNTGLQIEERGLKTGLPVFFAPRVEEYTHYVFLEQLRQLKGSDASWEHNNEPPAQFVEYSDDEEEQRARARQRGRDRDKDTAADENGEQQQGKKRPRPHRKKKKVPTATLR